MVSSGEGKRPRAFNGLLSAFIQRSSSCRTPHLFLSAAAPALGEAGFAQGMPGSRGGHGAGAGCHALEQGVSTDCAAGSGHSEGTCQGQGTRGHPRSSRAWGHTTWQTCSCWPCCWTLREGVLESGPEGKGDGFIKVSRRQVSLLPPRRPGSRTGSLSAEGRGRRWFHRVCLLSAAVASCISFSAAEQLQEDVVTVSIAV